LLFWSAIIILSPRVFAFISILFFKILCVNSLIYAKKIIIITWHVELRAALTHNNFRKVFSSQIFQENIFLKTKLNFPFTRKCFPLTNFSNGKQTQESLESSFPKTTFQKTNTTKSESTFLKTKLNFSLTRKCFPLTGKCFRWLESVFCWPTFLMANKYRKVWKIKIFPFTRKYFLLINFSNDK
jgi:hypothetical protein